MAVVTETVRERSFWDYAGFWQRCGALVLDSLLLSLLGTVLHLAIEPFVWPGFGMTLMSDLHAWPGILVAWAYFVLFTSFWQATPGKRLLGIRLTDASGRPPSVQRVLLREVVGRPLSVILLGLGYLMVAFTEEKRALHDVLAGTWAVTAARPSDVAARLQRIAKTLASEGHVSLDTWRGVPRPQRAALAAEYVQRYPEEAVLMNGVLRLTGKVELI